MMIRISNVNDPFLRNSIWVACKNMINDCRTTTTYASWAENKLLSTELCPWLKVKTKIQNFHISGYFSSLIVHIFKNSSSLVTLKSKFLKSEQLTATSLARNLSNCSLPLSPSTELILLFWKLLTQLDQTSKASGSTMARLIRFRQAAFHIGLYCKGPFFWIFKIIVWSICFS